MTSTVFVFLLPLSIAVTYGGTKEEEVSEWEKMEFVDPAIWGQSDSAEPYKDADQYPKYTLNEAIFKHKLVARMPKGMTYMKDDLKLMSFKTENDPNVDIWFRISSSHEGNSRISWSSSDYKVSVLGCTDDSSYFDAAHRPTMTNVPSGKIKIWVIKKSTTKLKIVCNDTLVLDWDVPLTYQRPDSRKCLLIGDTSYKTWFLKEKTSKTDDMWYLTAGLDFKIATVSALATSGGVAKTTCQVLFPPDGEIPNKDKSACNICTAGTYMNAERTKCLPCEKGTKSAARAVKCEKCPKVQYTDDNINCKTCDVGKVGDEKGVSCSKCPTGKKRASGDEDCVSCNPGWISSAGASICRKCNEGEIPNDDLSDCEPCEEGKEPSDDYAQCVACPTGHYKSNGMTTCQTCEVGKEPSDDSTQCVACPTGHYKYDGMTTCQPCEVGKEPNDDSTQCVACPTGHYKSDGMTTCQACEIGKEPSDNNSACVACPTGHYKSNGMTMCQTCAVGQEPSVEKTWCVDSCLEENEKVEVLESELKEQKNKLVVADKKVEYLENMLQLQGEKDKLEAAEKKVESLESELKEQKDKLEEADNKVEVLETVLQLQRENEKLEAAEKKVEVLETELKEQKDKLQAAARMGAVSDGEICPGKGIWSVPKSLVGKIITKQMLKQWEKNGLNDNIRYLGSFKGARITKDIATYIECFMTAN